MTEERQMTQRPPRLGSSTPTPVPGLGIDWYGAPAIDPTKNVLDLVAAAIERQDDLREQESRHLRELADLRAVYDQRLREAETARIDAIRAVDVGAVNRAAEVSVAQAQTLANQVAVSAETLRTQVAAAASAASTALAGALGPIQKDIADLRRAQYEAQGQKTQVVEARDVTTASRLNINTVMAVISVLFAAAIVYAAFHK
jgi:hypothetical protein